MIRTRWWASLLLQTIIVVHTVDEAKVVVNIRAIITIGRPGPTMHTDARCMLTLVDGKFLTTRETCREVVDLIAKAPPVDYPDDK